MPHDTIFVFNRTIVAKILHPLGPICTFIEWFKNRLKTEIGIVRVTYIKLLAHEFIFKKPEPYCQGQNFKLFE